MRARITRSFTFQAAHQLPHVPDGHKCGHVHGHSYTVILGVEGEIDPHLGWVVDYGDLTACFEPLRRQLDHSLLNDIAGLENPTAELLAHWIYERVKPDVPALSDVTVQETPYSAAIYRAE
jgi:6-pyruvoyltetrahydropterin/6-carboxytetrahydropterin synthase